MNKVIMMGRIASGLELKQTSNGVMFCNFRLAVDSNFQKKEDETVTYFFNVVTWRNTAEFVSKWFSKGRLILIEGELQSRPYTDKNGNSSTWIEIVVDQAHFTGEKNNNSLSQTVNVPTSTQETSETTAADVEAFPF